MTNVKDNLKMIFFMNKLRLYIYINIQLNDIKKK